MADVKLATDVIDLDMTDGKLTLTASTAAHAQRAAMHYRTFMGESRYDRSAGMPWLQVIFAQRMPPEATAMILDLYGRSIPGIEHTDLLPEFDTTTRKLTVTGTITTIDGDVEFAVAPLGV